MAVAEEEEEEDGCDGDDDGGGDGGLGKVGLAVLSAPNLER